MIYNFPRIVIKDLIKKKYPVLNPQRHIDLAISWLSKAQDVSTDDGVSTGYHLIKGWLPSYPETTGYIAKTFFEIYKSTGNEELHNRAVKMLDWTCSIIDKFGVITDMLGKHKLVFDTGQVLLGLNEGYKTTKNKEYLPYIDKLSKWLTEVQDEDGSWRQFSLNDIPHAYYIRVAWALADAGQILNNTKYIDAAKRNGLWVIKNQMDNGWFQQASFRSELHSKPFTHTIAYTIRGLLEIGILLEDNSFIDRAGLPLQSIYSLYKDSDYIPSTLNENWQGEKSESCLTGDAQLSILFSKMAGIKQNKDFENFAKKINNYLCGRQIQKGNSNIKGGIAGSYPVWGSYIHFCLPNWAAKFFIDALIAAN